MVGFIMRLFIIMITLLILQPAQANNFVFEADLKIDRDFLKDNQKRLLSEYSRLLKYFKVKLRKPVVIQVMPYQKNINFKNCARIYGPYKIYSHSPNSLKKMPMDERASYNSECFRSNYDDLYLTLIHEFTHSLTHINTNTGKIPKWIWEGIAVAVSGEMSTVKWKKRITKKLENYQEINLCQSNILENDIYYVSGATIGYLESRNPKFILKLVQHLRKDNDFTLAKSFLSSFKQTCKINVKSISSYLKSIK